MAKRREFNKEIENINQIYEKKEPKQVDSYIKLYTQVVREISESLKQKTNLLNIYFTEEMNSDKISCDKMIYHHFKKLQNSSKI
ncbi:MAG: hypothetical protein ACFE88_14670 [Candidatus Hermodarchaeota archaeon]